MIKKLLTFLGIYKTEPEPESLREYPLRTFTVQENCTAIRMNRQYDLEQEIKKDSKKLEENGFKAGNKIQIFHDTTLLITTASLPYLGWTFNWDRPGTCHLSPPIMLLIYRAESGELKELRVEGMDAILGYLRYHI